MGQPPLPSGEYGAAADALRLEHLRLDEQLEDLLRAKGLANLASVLEQICSALSAHFLHEQSPRGPFELMRERLPASRGRVDRLVEEHDRILALVRGLAARSRALADRERDLYDEAVRIVERIHDHETQEDILVDEGRRGLRLGESAHHDGGGIVLEGSAAAKRSGGVEDGVEDRLGR